MHVLWYIAGLLAAAMFFTGGYCLATVQCRCRERIAREEGEAVAQERLVHMEKLVKESYALYDDISLLIQRFEGRL